MVPNAQSVDSYAELGDIAADLDKALLSAGVSRAVASLKAGQREAALATARGLTRIQRVDALSATILGLVSISSGAPDEGLAWTERALARDPGFADALKARATALTELLRYTDANAAFAEAFRAGCMDPAAHFNHGNVLVALQRTDDAIAAFDRALQLKPDYPEALRAGATILCASHRSEQALMFLSEALRLNPNYVEASLDKANLLDALDRPAEALDVLDAALEHRAGHAQLLNNRGVILFHVGRLQDALEALATALLADPKLAAAYLNMGEIKIRQGLFDEALALLDRALALREAYPDAYCAKGIALKLLGRFKDAGEAFEAALRHDPGSVYALTNRGELALLLGDFDNGWADYDFRFSTRGHARPVLSWPVPEWAGEPNPGRVLVFADQAAGDVIHFARYLPILKATGADVTLVCRARMQRLLRKASAGMTIVDQVPQSGAFDYQIPLSNMPHACQTNLQNMPADPYIEAEDAVVDLWRERVGSEGFRVGICWRGSQDWRSDPKRSVPLAALRTLADIPNLRLISLQMADNLGPDSDMFAALRIETLPATLDSGPDGFVETVAVMANLDLVVSCDTSIAHLAGAMGKPTFVLLQRVPEWRFMIERQDCPWYPSMRLFRQVEQDRWDEPAADLARAIAALVEPA